MWYNIIIIKFDIGIIADIFFIKKLCSMEYHYCRVFFITFDLVSMNLLYTKNLFSLFVTVHPLAKPLPHRY